VIFGQFSGILSVCFKPEFKGDSRYTGYWKFRIREMEINYVANDINLVAGMLTGIFTLKKKCF
jgi:hypothetical protein